MPRRWQTRLLDLLEACQRVEGYLAGAQELDFLANRQAVESVAFNLLIIGEAAAAIPPEVTARAPAIPWQAMRSMRNRIAHRYFDLDPQIVWQTATVSLPALVEPILALLAEAGEE